MLISKHFLFPHVLTSRVMIRVTPSSPRRSFPGIYPFRPIPARHPEGEKARSSGSCALLLSCAQGQPAIHHPPLSPSLPSSAREASCKVVRAAASISQVTRCPAGRDLCFVSAAHQSQPRMSLCGEASRPLIATHVTHTFNSHQACYTEAHTIAIDNAT